MFYVMDVWEWAAVLLLPVWIAGITALVSAILEWHDSLGRWGLPVYMGLCVPLGLIGAAVPTAMLMRYIDRSIHFDRCVTTYQDALRPGSDCPEWTVQPARERLARMGELPS